MSGNRQEMDREKMGVANRWSLARHSDPGSTGAFESECNVDRNFLTAPTATFSHFRSISQPEGAKSLRALDSDQNQVTPIPPTWSISITADQSSSIEEELDFSQRQENFSPVFCTDQITVGRPTHSKSFNSLHDMRSSSTEGSSVSGARSIASWTTVQQRHLSTDSDAFSLLAGRLAFSRSFTERYGSAQSSSMRKMSSTTLDTKQVRIYLKRQNSRGSLNSTASVGLVDAVNAGAYRPLSADGTPPTPATTPLSERHGVAPSSSGRYAATGRVPPPEALAVSPTSASKQGPTILEMPPVGRCSSIPAGLGATGLRLKSSFSDKVCQVTNYLYMGSIESAYNANLLCRLNIEYIIDISNVEPQNVPRNKRSDCPCLCPLETAHSRYRMTITIDEQSQIDLLPYFRDVNRFIEPARQASEGGGKSALIYSYHGRNRCAVLALQHLIKTQSLTLQRAEQRLKSLWPAVRVSDNFHRALARWEALCTGGPINDEYYAPLVPSVTAASNVANNAAAVPLLQPPSSVPVQPRRAAWM